MQVFIYNFIWVLLPSFYLLKNCYNVFILRCLALFVGVFSSSYKIKKTTDKVIYFTLGMKLLLQSVQYLPKNIFKWNYPILVIVSEFHSFSSRKLNAVSRYVFVSTFVSRYNYWFADLNVFDGAYHWITEEIYDCPISPIST